jgi:hypothetical protein
MNAGVTRRLASFPAPLIALCLMAAVSLGCGKRGGESLGPSQPVAGAGAPASPAPSTAPSPFPVPTPAPATPQDEPEPSPSPDCIHDTYHGVDSVSLVIYFLECGGDHIPGRPNMTEVPLGCRIHFNATPRDGMNAPTCSKTWPVWQVGPEELVTGNGFETFTPAYTPKATGVMSARCLVDGVRSGWIVLKIVDR